MQTHHDTSAAISTGSGSLPLFQEGACLVCGTNLPFPAPSENLEQKLRAAGWHSWLSRLTPGRHLALLRLCPECVSDPMLVATRILESHGPDQMEEWIRSVELELGGDPRLKGTEPAVAQTPVEPG